MDTIDIPVCVHVNITLLNRYIDSVHVNITLLNRYIDSVHVNITLLNWYVDSVHVNITYLFSKGNIYMDTIDIPV
jgi:hypothetical protein